MRRIMGALNMYALDYLIVPVWAVFSVLGNIDSAKIMVPITAVFLALNYFSTRNSTKLFLTDINLAAASVAGIILNTFLHLKFAYADPEDITHMVAIIFGFTLYIIAGCVISLLVKVLLHKRNMRIINSIDDGEFDFIETRRDYDEEDDDEDEYEDEEEIDVKKRRGFISSIKDLIAGSDDEDEEEEEDEPDEDEDEEEEEDDGYTKPDGPKFRVIKK